MLKILKSNAESRKIALIEKEQHVSLFHYKNIRSTSYYVTPHQHVTICAKTNELLLLHIMEGRGELQVTTPPPLHLHIIHHDVILLPDGFDYHVTNITNQLLMFTVTAILQ